MAKRKVIKIDEEKCTGCRLCIPNCPEGALQIIDGKARLISDLFCDGLGACIGHCPEAAIIIEEREAEDYDEGKVIENIIKQGKNVIKAHLKHLKDHNQDEYLKQALDFLKEKEIDISPEEISKDKGEFSGCPGSKVMEFSRDTEDESSQEGKRSSQLRQWPIQLHLVPTIAPYFQGKDVVLSADCIAYTLGDFHKDYLKGKSIAIACPKLDSKLDVYINKITSLIDDAKINTLTVMTMEVPCCSGLLHIATEAAKKASRKIPLRSINVSIHGEILQDEWIKI